MPAIDPERLARQVAGLRPAASDPEALATAVRDLTEEYLDRTRREGAAEPLVPPPVHRALLAGLEAVLASGPALEAAAAALWRIGTDPVRRLAASLLGSTPEAFVPTLAESWTSEPLPSGVVQVLGEAGLAAWRRRHPAESLERAGRWLAGRRLLLGLYALRGAVRDAEFDDLPAVFELIDGVGGKTRGDSRQAFELLIEGLAVRSPVETARFLTEQAQPGGPGSAWLRGLAAGLSRRRP
jgi:hypothetical protein